MGKGKAGEVQTRKGRVKPLDGNVSREGGEEGKLTKPPGVDRSSLAETGGEEGFSDRKRKAAMKKNRKALRLRREKKLSLPGTDQGADREGRILGTRFGWQKKFGNENRRFLVVLKVEGGGAGTHLHKKNGSCWGEEGLGPYLYSGGKFILVDLGGRGGIDQGRCPSQDIWPYGGLSERSYLHD